MVRVYKIIGVFLFLTFAQSVFAQGYLEFVAKAKGEKGFLNDAWGIALKEGKKVDYSGVDDQGNIVFDLEYGSLYTIEIKEKNHETFIVKIDTRVPGEMKKFTYSYAPTLPLAPTIEGKVVKYIKDPTMYVSYIKEKDRFGMKQEYDAPYVYKDAPDPEIVEVEKNSNNPKDKASNPKEVVVVAPIKKDTTQPKTVPAQPTADVDQPVKDSVITPVTAIPKEKNTTQSPVIKPKPIDDLQERNNNAKKVREELSHQQEIAKENDIKNLMNKASVRRRFMEELADSKKFIKMGKP